MELTDKDPWQPFVSVLVPTYNRRPLLEKTLDTLLAQTYPNFEVLVCDNCSTDDTYDFLLTRQKTCPRLKVFRNDRNLNFHGNLFRLFSLATGELIGMQHDHDLYKPEFLSNMVELLRSYPSAGFGSSAYHMIDTNEQLTLDPALPRGPMFRAMWGRRDGSSIFGEGLVHGGDFVRVLANWRHTPIAAMSTLFRRNILEQAGGYRIDWYLASDEDLYRRVSSIADVAFCPDQLLSMRWRPEDSQTALGGWKFIYNLFLYRMSVADLLAQNSLSEGIRARLRQYRYKWIWLLHDGIYFWLRGNAEELRRATELSSVSSLPTARKALYPFESMVLKSYMAILRAVIRLGPPVNKIRRRLKKQQ